MRYLRGLAPGRMKASSARRSASRLPQNEIELALSSCRVAHGWHIAGIASVALAARHINVMFRPLKMARFRLLASRLLLCEASGENKREMRRAVLGGIMAWPAACRRHHR